MKILLLMQDWFKEEFKAAGHEVLTAALHDQFDFTIPSALCHIDIVIKELPNGFVPDVIIYWDNSAPILVSGLEETVIPTLFYSVDAHHHAFSHAFLANIFDYTLVAQSDYIPIFQGQGSAPEWMPLWASRFVEASQKKEHKVVFVGNLDPKLHPERAKFFEELGKHVPLVCKMGEYWKIFPLSEIVVNQTVKGDLNFRVFEAMMCGALLLTEQGTNGLCDLFRDGEHLILYERNNVDDATHKISSLLVDPTRMRRIAKQGRDEILRKHTTRHRSSRVLEILASLKKKTSPVKFMSAGVHYCSTAIQIAKLDSASCLHALVNSLKSFTTAMKYGEKFSNETASPAILASIKYDMLTAGKRGADFIGEMYCYDPNNLVLALGQTRTLLNQGKHGDAAVLAHKAAPGAEPRTFFTQAEEFIHGLLKDANT